MTIKKAYKDIVELLEANKNKKVSTVLPEILELVSAKKGGGGNESTVQYDENGVPVAIFCYYHKRWEPVEYFGKKASTKSGYNTMCKVGVSKWTSRNKAIKAIPEQLLEQVAAGELDIAHLKEVKEAKIKELKEQVDYTDAPPVYGEQEQEPEQG